jgi:cytochrome c biogenesis protein CcdA
VGGGLVGLFLGWLGSYLSTFSGPYRSLFPLFIGLFALAYALHELRLVSLPYPQRQQQVPAHWRYQFHPYLTAGLFGFFLGTGFVTFIPTATYYILAVAAAFYGSPAVGALVFMIYGAARALPLWLASRQISSPTMIEILTDYMDVTKPIMSQVNGFALAMASAYLVNAYLSLR